MKKILLLGATGSIGQQTIDVIEQHPDEFELVGIAAGHQEDKLHAIYKKHPGIQGVGLTAFTNPEAFQPAKVYSGENMMEEMVKDLDYDLLVNATVGFRGLKPTLAAIQRDKNVALANKETLVAGGDLVKKEMEKHPVHLYPIDSEHSAIFQCLQGNKKEQVKRLIITASGGSFRDKKREELKDVSVEQALAHPNWNMGKRITIDSATMVNKGFEVIEAHHLFDIDYDHIDVVLHAQSIVHSMVEYKDNAVIAQMGSADMRLPIQYAIHYPERINLKEEHPLDMTKTLTLNFKEMDFERYPMLKVAYEVGKAKGNAGAVFNGADEEAVAQFLNKNISFLDIESAIVHALKTVPYISDPSLSDLLESDKLARKAVKEYVKVA